MAAYAGAAGASVGRHIRPDALRAGPLWPGGAGRGWDWIAGWLGRGARLPRAPWQQIAQCGATQRREGMTNPASDAPHSNQLKNYTLQVYNLNAASLNSQLSLN